MINYYLLCKSGGDVCGTVEVEPGCNIDILPFGGETFDCNQVKQAMVKLVRKAEIIAPRQPFKVAGREFYLEH